MENGDRGSDETSPPIGGYNNIERQIEYVDKLTSSPEDRAKRVGNIIIPLLAQKKMTDWDLLCFCLSFLVSQSTHQEWLRQPVRALNRIIYNAHYYFYRELGLVTDEGTRTQNPDTTKGS